MDRSKANLLAISLGFSFFTALSTGLAVSQQTNHTSSDAEQQVCSSSDQSATESAGRSNDDSAPAPGAVSTEKCQAPPVDTNTTNQSKPIYKSKVSKVKVFKVKD